MPGRGRAARRGRGRRVQPPRRAANRGQPDMQPEVPFQQPAAPAQPEQRPARRAANRGQPDMQPEVPFQQPAAPAQPEQRPAKRLRANADTLDEPDRDIWILGDSIPHWAGVRAKYRSTEHLNLPGGVTVAWWGVRGMGWDDFIHQMQLPVLFRSPPKVIVLHLGGNNIVQHSLKVVFKLVQESVEYLAKALPDVVLL